MTNQTKEESLARWVAEKVGNRISADPTFFRIWYGRRGSHDQWSEPLEYLNCKNVAGQLLEWADDINRAGQHLTPQSRLDFRLNAWQNTPAAIEELAKACGWTAPIIDNDTEKK